MILAGPIPSTLTESLSRFFERLFKTTSASPVSKVTVTTLVTWRGREGIENDRSDRRRKERGLWLWWEAIVKTTPNKAAIAQ